MSFTKQCLTNQSMLVFFFLNDYVKYTFRHSDLGGAVDWGLVSINMVTEGVGEDEVKRKER